MRIKLIHGSATVAENVSQETINMLNKLSELAYVADLTKLKRAQSKVFNKTLTMETTYSFQELTEKVITKLDYHNMYLFRYKNSDKCDYCSLAFYEQMKFRYSHVQLPVVTMQQKEDRTEEEIRNIITKALHTIKVVDEPNRQGRTIHFKEASDIILNFILSLLQPVSEGVEIKPLSEITDEDAIQVAKILSWGGDIIEKRLAGNLPIGDTKEQWIKKSIRAGKACLLEKPFYPNKHIKAYQYLQSKNYQLPKYF